MHKIHFAVLCGMLCCSSLVTAADYAIVISQATFDDADWQPVVKVLTDKHEGAALLKYQQDVTETLEPLGKLHPRYTCFVATPTEASREFVAAVHQMTRRLDDDPYTDTLWGILTGYDAESALEIAKDSQPLTVRKVASGTEVALGMCTQGLWYDELVKNKQVVKTAGDEAQQKQGPADTTRALADTLTDYEADLFVTSGHATERNWQIGYSYRNGQFRSEAGQMFGVTLDGDRFEIQSDNPKVFLPIGNCLMGHIDGPDAMALAWMNSVSVRQMMGYTVVTWYGYGGWGVLDYFVEQPGRYTLTEAFHANHHALIHRLHTYFDVPAYNFDASRPPRIEPNDAGKLLGLTANDARGLLWDRDAVAFYGDPAWTARMAPMENAYNQKLEVNGDTYIFTVTPNRGADSFKPINTNGAQRGWRPIVELLPQRIKDVKIVTGSDLHPVVTDDFILIPNPRECDSSKDYRIVFTAKVVK